MTTGGVRGASPVPAPRPHLQTLADPERVRAVRRVLASGPLGARLDRLVRHAATSLATPYAQLSLLGEDEQVIVAGYGVALPDGARRAPLAETLSAVTAASGATLVVPDARVHPWVRDLPSVTSGEVGCYLGVVLRDAEGVVLGSLGVFGSAPRPWCEAQLDLLTDIGALVAAELDEHASGLPLDAEVRAGVAIAAADLGSFVYDLGGDGHLDWDERMVALHGFADGAFDGTFATWRARVHPDDLPAVLKEIEVATARLREIVCEYRVVLPDAEPRWIRIRGRVLPDMLGRATHIVGAAYDASPERGLRDELVRLTETMPTALVRIGRDWTFTYVNALAEQMYGRTRDQLVGVSIYEAFPEVRDTEFDRAYARVMATGEPGMVEAWFEPLDTTFEVRIWPDDQGLTLFFHDVSERVRAQDALRRVGERLQLLADAGARLTGSLRPQEVLNVLADVVVPQLAASLVLAVTGPVAELLGEAIHADPDRLYPVLVTHVDPLVEKDLLDVMTSLTLRVSAESGVGGVVQTGQPQAYSRVPDELLRARAASPAQYEQMVRLNTGPRLTLPLTAPGGVLGAFTVSAGADDPLDEVLLLDLAARAAGALDNALSFARQHRAATVLQRALLPNEAPVVPDVEVATRYLPASAQALVGGDFFKTVDVDGVLVCALGDVMGHGTASAARAGQLHGLVAALALQGLGPGELLTQLARGIDQMMDLQLATLLVCAYDPRTRRLTTASAGHPPPLVVPADAAPQYVDVEPGTPIGVSAGSYPERTLVLAPGSTVLLFSDGLVERRGESLTDGLERLRHAVTGLHLAPEQVCDHVLTAVLPEAGSSDDIALLALRHL